MVRTDCFASPLYLYPRTSFRQQLNVRVLALGWQLGEHDLWNKMTMFEAATRVPLIIRCPWMTNAVDKVTWALSELVDPLRVQDDLVPLKPTCTR